jgi:hypothetical protein
MRGSTALKYCNSMGWMGGSARHGEGGKDAGARSNRRSTASSSACDVRVCVWSMVR